jgi:hypothetical protein
MEQSVEVRLVGAASPPVARNVQIMARDEYSTCRRVALLDDSVEALERGSVGIVCGDTVSRGYYPDDVSGRLTIGRYDKKRGSAEKEATENTPQRRALN